MSTSNRTPLSFVSWESRWRAKISGWVTFAKREQAEAHQLTFQPEARQGVQKSIAAPGVRWDSVNGYDPSNAAREYSDLPEDSST